jgi:hypothetical protein
MTDNPAAGINTSLVLELRQVALGPSRTTDQDPASVDRLLELELIDWHAGGQQRFGRMQRASEAGLFVTAAGSLALAIIDLGLGTCTDPVALALWDLGSTRRQAEAMARGTKKPK